MLNSSARSVTLFIYTLSNAGNYLQQESPVVKGLGSNSRGQATVQLSIVQNIFVIDVIYFDLSFFLLNRSLFQPKNRKRSSSDSKHSSSRSSSVNSGTDSGIERTSLDGDVNRQGIS